MTKTTIELVKELKSNKCQCGNIKQPHQTFCRKCYYSLPIDMRYNLYDLIGEGYEEAYEAAIQFLEKKAKKNES